MHMSGAGTGSSIAAKTETNGDDLLFAALFGGATGDISADDDKADTAVLAGVFAVQTTEQDDPENPPQDALIEMIAALQGQSIDFVYGMDDAILTGGIKALEEAGLVMGKDVIAVGTVCNGDKQLIEEGKQFGTTLQSPLHEGQLAIKMVEEYLNTGKLENYINFTPNPSVTAETIETTALRGYDGKLYTIEELCSGAWGG